MLAIQKKQGFTLIELLTVIMIIGILASISIVVGPRMIERAKVRRMVGAMRNIEQAMTAYYGDEGSYPANYGYVTWTAKDKAPASLGSDDYCLRPYMATIGMLGVEDVYDEFSWDFRFDTDRDGVISLLEFQPIGKKDLATQTYRFPATELYDEEVAPSTPELSAELDRLLAERQRPFVYIPVNSRNAKLARKCWISRGDVYAEKWYPGDASMKIIQFPPPRYDAYVLISPGPGRNTGGVLPVGLPEGLPESMRPYRYHVQALRAFFLATRDLDDNGELDFHFEARTQRGESKNPANLLPCGVNDDGPFIYVVQ